MNTKLRLSLLSLWLGTASLFSFVVAPAAFKALPSPWLAGNVVNRVLGVTEYIGIIIGVVLLLLLLAAKPMRLALWLQGVMLALMTFSMVLSKFVVSARLHLLRETYGEALSTKQVNLEAQWAFDLFHQLSVGLMSFNLLATLALIVYLIRQPNSSGKSHV
jgi:Na+(H+)/acetate symporter ActP